MDTYGEFSEDLQLPEVISGRLALLHNKLSPHNENLSYCTAPKLVTTRVWSSLVKIHRSHHISHNADYQEHGLGARQLHRTAVRLLKVDKLTSMGTLFL